MELLREIIGYLLAVILLIFAVFAFKNKIFGLIAEVQEAEFMDKLSAERAIYQAMLQKMR